MPTYSVANLAASVLDSVLRFTARTWGIAQARRYSKSLRACFQLLAESPSIGRTCDFILSVLRRHEHGKHVVLYILDHGEVLVIRVLHQQMIPTKAHFEQ